MAVAIERMDSELRKATAKAKAVKAKVEQVKKPKVKLTKFYGQCEMLDGSVTFIVAKAACEQDVSKQLHKYRIAMVLDILTEDEMDKVWDRLKPSNIQRPVLK